MKTDQLIAILTDDLKPARRGRVARGLLAGLAGGVALSLLAMLLLLKPRPDLSAAMQDGPFWMKFSYTLALALLGLCHPAAPGARRARIRACPSWPFRAAPVVALIVLASVQMSAPQADSAALVMGSSWMVCPWLIAALALPVYGGLLLALRRLAPTRLSLAGAAAGLLSGASAATVYGFHCPEIAAPFIVIWYTLGIGVAAGLGALAGPKLLRW